MGEAKWKNKFLFLSICKSLSWSFKELHRWAESIKKGDKAKIFTTAMMKFLSCLLRKLCKNGPLLYATGKNSTLKTKQNQSANSQNQQSVSASGKLLNTQKIKFLCKVLLCVPLCFNQSWTWFKNTFVTIISLRFDCFHWISLST